MITNDARALSFVTGALIFAVLASQVCDAGQDRLDLPVPNGCYAIGVRTVVLKDVSRNRDLLVTMWYPAERGTSPLAPYLDAQTANELAKVWQLQLGFQIGVYPHARLQASIARGGPFPVVLLEHGSGTVPGIYTVLAEGLASTGFIVVATNHPPDSMIAAYPDGRQIKFTPYWPLQADRKTQGQAIGQFAETVLMGDVRFVLDQLQEMQSKSRFWRGHLDLSRVGIVGHSMGGTTAALATKEERRILAGVNLDGSTYPGMNADVRPIELDKPFLFVATEEHASDPLTHAREFIGSKLNTYYVVVSGAGHMSFTDAALLSSRFSRDARSNSSTFEHATLIATLTRSLVEEFFSKYLEGTEAPHLDLSIRVDRT